MNNIQKFISRMFCPFLLSFTDYYPFKILIDLHINRVFSTSMRHTKAVGKTTNQTRYVHSSRLALSIRDNVSLITRISMTTHIRTYEHTHIHTYAHTHIRTYAHTHIRTYEHTHIRTYAHTHIHTYTHTHTVDGYNIKSRDRLAEYVSGR